MNFREWYGLSPKPLYYCPVCGVETKGRKGRPQQCGTHKQNSDARKLRRLLRVAITEARAQP